MKREEAIAIIEGTNYTNFFEMARKVFDYQSVNLSVYRQFLDHIGFNRFAPFSVDTLPFLPISAFKWHNVLIDGLKQELTYYSSSTGGKGPSRHLIADNSIYRHSYNKAFRQFYGDPNDWCILCLLPGYLEREGSSLIAMAQDLVRQSRDADSGFFLHNHEDLNKVLLKKIAERKKTLLLGVSFALLDFAENYALPKSETLVVMETGGMKGRKKEPLREELHQFYQTQFGVDKIHSEYGMTELLSQSYSQGDGLFYCPPWLRVFVKDQSDPFSKPIINQRGRLCLIDLANVYSCSFIETEDLGRVFNDGSFEVLGRIDHSDMRGCNVMV